MNQIDDISILCDLIINYEKVRGTVGKRLKSLTHRLSDLAENVQAHERN